MSTTEEVILPDYGFDVGDYEEEKRITTVRRRDFVETIRQSGPKEPTIPYGDPSQPDSGIFLRLAPVTHPTNPERPHSVHYRRAFVHWLQLVNESGELKWVRVVCSGEHSVLYPIGTRPLDPESCLACRYLQERANQSNVKPQKLRGVPALNYYWLVFNLSHREEHYKTWADYETSQGRKPDPGLFVPPLSLLEGRAKLRELISAQVRNLEWGPSPPWSYRIRLYKMRGNRANLPDERMNVDYYLSPVQKDYGARESFEFSEAEQLALTWFNEGRPYGDEGQSRIFPDLGPTVDPTPWQEQEELFIGMRPPAPEQELNSFAESGSEPAAAPRAHAHVGPPPPAARPPVRPGAAPEKGQRF